MGTTCIFSDAVRCNCLTTLQRVIPDSWMIFCTLFNAADYKDTVEVNSYIITIVKLTLPFELDPNVSDATE